LIPSFFTRGVPEYPAMETQFRKSRERCQREQRRRKVSGPS
jgi:hypothetical protein